MDGSSVANWWMDDADEQAMNTTAPRINGQAIAPLLPSTGPVQVLIVGEAPGPRGADKSGFPFFGDAAGKHLYLALRELNAVVLPPSVDAVKWDGQLLREAGLIPVAHGVSLTNAYDRCPTDDGVHFRAPSKRELDGASNYARLKTEIESAKVRGLKGIVTLGKVATRTMQNVSDHFFSSQIPVHALPHPSAQGLLSMAPNRGRGARMSDLQSQWMRDCMAAVVAAGFQHEFLATSVK
jgi:uracil-DNA glycosylase